MINLVIPMAGRGERFRKAGYDIPKPFIPILAKPMIEHVVDTFPLQCRKIFLVLEEHLQQYGTYLRNRWPGSEIVPVNGVTEGAACTVLLARHLIDSYEPLFIMNSDNIIEWSPEAMKLVDDCDGIIFTFEDPSMNPKWSYAKLEGSYVIEVAEKKPISTHATAGLYFWLRGKDFVDASLRMIADGDRVNNEFYVAPVYNYNVKAGRKIKIYPVDEMHGVGTPEDLEIYLNEQARSVNRP